MVPFKVVVVDDEPTSRVSVGLEVVVAFAEPDSDDDNDDDVVVPLIVAKILDRSVIVA